MADNSLGYRTSPGFARSRPATEHHTPGSAHDPDNRGFDNTTDPLAELARLVGQIDPPADLRGGAGREGGISTLDRAGDYSDRSRQGVDAQRDYGHRTDHTQAPPLADYNDDDQYDRDPDASYAAEHPRAVSGGYTPADRGQPQYDAHYEDEHGHAAADHQHSDQQHSDQQYAGEQYADQQHADHQYDDQQYDDQQYADRQHADGQYRDGDAEYPAYEDADDNPRRGKRSGLVTVAAVFGLAVLGTAAAYGYRTFTSGGSTGAPPVIRADASPNKIAATPSDAASSKQVVDRVGDRAQTQSRVVSREEQPLPVEQPPRPQPQMAAPAWPLPPGSPPVSTAQAPQSSGASPGEPRRVKTETIAPSGAQVASQATAPAVRTAASTESANRPAAPRTTPKAADQNAPLALAPQGDTPSRPAAAATSPAHKYVVQLSASNTREDAAASLRTAQSKYADLLNGRQTLVKEKKSANQTTVYAAQVGPLSSKEEAVELCQRLKSAGATCFVQ
jgi:SPOR domain